MALPAHIAVAVAVAVLAVLVALWVRLVEPRLWPPPAPTQTAQRPREYTPPPPRPHAGLAMSPGSLGHLEAADALLVAMEAYRAECAARAAAERGLPPG
jgi:hypothetical protein